MSARGVALAWAGAVALACAGLAPAVAQPLRFSDGPQSATCERFDLASGIAWRRKQGDWRDARGTLYGEHAFAEALVRDIDQIRGIEFDVTRLVADWLAGRAPAHGFVLRPSGAQRDGDIHFHSRESTVAALRPSLTLEFAGEAPQSLGAAADTMLNCTTYRALGTGSTFAVGRGSTALLRFDLPDAGARRLTRATLRVVTTDTQYGELAIGVYALDPPLATPARPLADGLAAAFRLDRGLERDPRVVLVEGFEARNWRDHWSHVGATGTWEVVEADAALGFVPLAGRALKVNLAKGQHMGLDMRFLFRERVGREPDAIHFRYYLRLASDWRPIADGGKLPGIAGTYDKGGWGGRRADGRNGWSMRGGFAEIVAGDHPLAGQTPIGTYAYHVDAADKYGEFWPWSQGGPGTLQRNRWYCIEQYVKVNTPGKRDGIVRAWIDGIQVFERTDVRVRDVDALRIEGVWLDIYHGGTEVSPFDQHLYLDGVVIAHDYIGPMAR